MFRSLRGAVRELLESEYANMKFAQETKWSLQGFGMLRFYLPGNVRLHIWDSSGKVDDVSEVHTHPWNMKSTVVSGRIENILLSEDEFGLNRMNRQRIKCGEGGGTEGKPEETGLLINRTEVVLTGEAYAQDHTAIHISRPAEGTVTIIERHVPPGGHPDYAFVYYPVDEEWVSAEPRAAKPFEVREAIELALDRWGSRE